MKRFPFPDKESSMEDLKNDYVFEKIEKDRVDEVFLEAWSVGEREAARFIEEYEQDGKISMTDLFRRSGFCIQNKEIDYVLGKRRYFCEYLSRRNILKIYTKSVELWSEHNGFSYEEGLNIILCHEYFHYLESHRIGEVSGHYQVPMIKIGTLRLGKTGVPSLSEIAANAFANTCFEYLVG